MPLDHRLDHGSRAREAVGEEFIDAAIEDLPELRQLVDVTRRHPRMHLELLTLLKVACSRQLLRCGAWRKAVHRHAKREALGGQSIERQGQRHAFSPECGVTDYGLNAPSTTRPFSVLPAVYIKASMVLAIIAD